MVVTILQNVGDFMDQYVAEQVGNQLARTGFLNSIEENPDVNAFKLAGVSFGVS
jgi:hypothetical protein